MSAKFPRGEGGGAGPFLARSLICFGLEIVNLFLITHIYTKACFHRARADTLYLPYIHYKYSPLMRQSQQKSSAFLVC